MKCPNCDNEERDRLLSSPCPKCAHEWWDTEEFVRMLAPRNCKRVMDVGCGNKGVIAQAFWAEVGIEKGYAVDRHVVKEMPEPWERRVQDVEEVLDELIERKEKLDFITHCGLLEHLEYDKGIRIMAKMYRALKSGGGMFVTASAVLREVDYKVRADGNPHHKYRSFWDGDTFESLGLHVYSRQMISGVTFLEEVVASHSPVLFPESWADIVEGEAPAILEMIAGRKCFQCLPEPGRDPVLWLPEGIYLCQSCTEYSEHYSTKPKEYFASL